MEHLTKVVHRSVNAHELKILAKARNPSNNRTQYAKCAISLLWKCINSEMQVSKCLCCQSLVGCPNMGASIHDIVRVQMGCCAIELK